MKNCEDCITAKVIKEQFIERDLFNATDISQIKWRIYGQNFTKQHFEKFLKENKEAIKSLLKNEKSKSNIEKWFDLKEGQSFISDEQIKIFKKYRPEKLQISIYGIDDKIMQRTTRSNIKARDILDRIKLLKKGILDDQLHCDYLL